MFPKWNTWHILVTGLLVFLIAQALDFVSTSLVMAYVPGSIELDPRMRNAATLKFAPLTALVVKGLYTGIRTGILSAGLFVGSRSWVLASFPWWFDNWVLLSAGAYNFVTLYAYTR